MISKASPIRYGQPIIILILYSSKYFVCHKQRKFGKESKKLYPVLAIGVLSEDMIGTKKKLVNPNQNCPNKFSKLWPNTAETFCLTNIKRRLVQEGLVSHDPSTPRPSVSRTNSLV